MMPGHFNEVAQWIGYGVMLVGALGLAAIVVFGLNSLIGLVFAHYIRRIGISAYNFQAIYQWDMAGRPEYKQDPVDGVFKMVKTKKIKPIEEDESPP